MGVQLIPYDHDIKRLRTFIDRTDGIQWYTRNNLYPQIVEAIRDRSYTIKSAYRNLAKFLRGEGFEDPAVAGLVVNDKGQTMNDILRLLAPDAATFSNAFVVHLGLNLLGEYTSISVWPLKLWRLGLPDESGDVHDVKYNSNWEQDPYKEINNAKTILTYPKFCTDRDKILQEIEEYGVNHPGHVFYVSPLEDEYPLATFDSVLDQGQTQEEIGMFRLSSIQNGLNATTIFSYPGKFETTEKERQVKEKLNEFIGGKGPGVMVVEDESEEKTKASDLIAHLSLPNNDKIHEFISKDDKNAIMEAFSQPKGIMGIFPETGMFNQQQLQEEYVWYNAFTRDDRAEISGAFKKIFKNWYQPVQSDFRIKELSYIKSGQTSNNNAA